MNPWQFPEATPWAFLKPGACLKQINKERNLGRNPGVKFLDGSQKNLLMQSWKKILAKLLEESWKESKEGLVRNSLENPKIKKKMLFHTETKLFTLNVTCPVAMFFTEIKLFMKTYSQGQLLHDFLEICEILVAIYDTLLQKFSVNLIRCFWINPLR